MSAELVEFESFTRIPVNFFLTLGIVPFQLESRKPLTRKRKILLNVWFWLSFLNTALCVLGEMIYMVLIINSTRFVELIGVVLCIGFIWLSFAKVGTALWRQRQLSSLTSKLYKMFPKNLLEQKCYRASEFAKRCRRMMRLYACLQMVMIALFTFTPLLNTIMLFVQHSVWSVDFAYLIWYPFDPYGRVWFELNYLSQMSAAYFAAAGILASDLLLCGLVFQMCMHFEYIGNRLRIYRPLGGRHSSLDHLRQRHQVRYLAKIMRLGTDLDVIFGECILFNFVSSILIICVLGFLVVTAGQSSVLLMYGLTLATCIGQIYLVCLLGQMMIESVCTIKKKLVHPD